MKRFISALLLACVTLSIGLAVVCWRCPARFYHVIEQIALKVPPQACWMLEKEQLLVIAHAGGAVGTQTYSNSLEALDLSYDKGCRFFELDFEWSEDGRLVLLHDWNATATRIFGSAFGGRWHSRQAFLAADRVDGLTSLDLDRLIVWLVQHADARVVTDVKDQNLRALSVLKTRVPGADHRVIPQIYSFEEYDPTREMGFDRIVLTLYRSDASDEEVVEFAVRNPLWAVAMPAARATGGLPELLAGSSTPTLAHTVNSPRHARFLLRRGVGGLFTDHLVACGGVAW